MIIERNAMERHPVEAGLTCVTNPLCHLHLRTDQMRSRVHIRSRKAILHGQPPLAGDRTQCQTSCHDTGEMRNEEHPVGKQTRATVRHRKNGGGTVHTELRPQETPPGKTDRKDKCWRRIHTVQQTDDMQAQHLDGRAPDTEGAPQTMHEESQGTRS